MELVKTDRSVEEFLDALDRVARGGVVLDAHPLARGQFRRHLRQGHCNTKPGMLVRFFFIDFHKLSG
jgi:hypothetical protein